MGNGRRRIGMSSMQGLSESTRTLAYNKPEMWEYLLFFEALRERCEKDRLLGEKDFEFPRMELPLLLNVLANTLDIMSEAGEELAGYINEDLQVALGAPGVEGEAVEIVQIAERISHIYGWMVRLRAAARRYCPPKILEDMLTAYGELFSDAIADIERYPVVSVRAIKRALSREDQDQNVVLDLSLTLRCEGANAFCQRVREAQARWEGGAETTNSAIDTRELMPRMVWRL